MNPPSPLHQAAAAAGAPVVVTLGCRLNSPRAKSCGACPPAGLDDAIIVNTCAVTGEAVRQADQTIRKLRRENPTARLIVTGCAAQIEPERFAEMAEVDHVIGNAEKMRAETFRGLAIDDTERVQVDDIMTRARNGLTSDRRLRHARTRAYVQVQNGCDHRCTFCIIPYGRGPSRSVPAGEVVAQIRRLVEARHARSRAHRRRYYSYGPDLPGTPTLGKLVHADPESTCPSSPRLRLSSIDQTETDADLLRCARRRAAPDAASASVDAGGRRHDPEAHEAPPPARRCHQVCAEARALRPDIVFGADLIAGFPTETEAMFANTLDIVDDCGLTYLHVFPFSPRKGTPAARMPQVGKTIVKSARRPPSRQRRRERSTAILTRQVGRRRMCLANATALAAHRSFAEVDVASRSRDDRADTASSGTAAAPPHRRAPIA